MVTQQDVTHIARRHLTRWEPLSPFLELSHTEEEEIRGSFSGNYGKQKTECLQIWKKIKGDKATYSAFITAAIEARDQLLADEVRNMICNRKVMPKGAKQNEGLQANVKDVKGDGRNKVCNNFRPQSTRISP